MLTFLCFSQGGWNCYDSFIHKANWRPDWSMEKPAKIQIQAKSGCEWKKWSILLTGFFSCLCTSDNAFCRALVFSWLEYNVVISIPLSHRCLGNTCLLALPATEMDTCTCIIVIHTQTVSVHSKTTCILYISSTFLYSNHCHIHIQCTNFTWSQ